jgi:hypothetical protein
MKTLSTVLTASCLILCSLTSHASDCASDKEKTALDSRALQSQLMVAALSCRTPDNYNSFMIKFKPELAAQNEVLEDYFSHKYSGKQSTGKLNQFMTALANEASKRSLKIDSKEFCQTTAKLFDKVMDSKPSKLYKIAAEKQFSSLHGIKGCNILSASNN